MARFKAYIYCLFSDIFSNFEGSPLKIFDMEVAGKIVF